MIPFLPSQNPNIAALLASVGGTAPRAGAESGGSFAPVFGNAIVGQIVSGLPASAFTGGEDGINPAAWAHLAEAVRVLTQNGNVTPATLEQMRGVMLVNIELLRRGAGEAVAMQASVLSPSLPVAPAGVQGVPVSDALIPAPSVPIPVQPEESFDASSRRRDAVGGAEAMLVAAASGMPVPAVSTGRPEMNVEQAFAVLERIVAQAPASELVPLARALRQVINAPVAVPAAGIRTVQVSAHKGGEMSPAVPAGGSASRAGETQPVPRADGAPSASRAVEVPVVSAEPVTTATMANPAPASVPQGAGTSQAVHKPSAPISMESGNAPAPMGGGVSAAPEITAGGPVSGMILETVGIVSMPAVQPMVPSAPRVGETVAAASMPAVQPEADAVAPAAFQPANPEIIPEIAAGSGAVVAPATAESGDVYSPAPMFIPADDARMEAVPAFSVSRQEPGVESDAVAVPSGEPAEIIAEPVDEPVAWLARQAQVGRAEVDTRIPANAAILPVIEGADQALAVPMAMTEAPVDPNPVIVAGNGGEPIPARAGGTGYPVIPSAAHDGAEMPAVSITTLEVETVTANSANRPRIVPAPAAENETPSAPIQAVADGKAQVSVQSVRQAVAVNAAAARPADSAVVAPEPVQAGAQSRVAAAVNPGEAMTPTASVPAEVAPGVAPSAVESAAPVSDEAPAADVPVLGGAEQDRNISREAGQRTAIRVNEDGGKGAKAQVAEAEEPAQAVERAGVSLRDRVARTDAPETANTAADAAINAARGQVREAISLPVAVQAVMARVADAISGAKPGEIRQLDLKLATPELGMVRVKFEVGEEGMVRVVIKTSTEQAAAAIREGLTQFRNTVENRHIAVEVAQVAVGTAADFGGGNNPHARPEWSSPFQTQAPVIGRDEPEFAARAPEGSLRRRTLVDILA